jgi:hypothetical protein
MKNISLRPVDPERDFRQLSDLFTLEQDDPTSESGLKTDYEEHKERIIRLAVAEDEKGELLGFNWGTRNRFDASRVYKTGVNKRYRGRKLGQALKVKTVRTHHTILNAPMIAIDLKFGYVQTSGIYTMEKVLE